MLSVLAKQYINQNLVVHGMTQKTLSDRADVPPSTLHSYIQGKTSNPNIDNLIRIAAVFGDPPEVIHAMRRSAQETANVENAMIKAADDKALMEKHAELVRATLSQLLDEYRFQTATQQQEIMQHADLRVAEAKSEASAQCSLVAEQCREHEQEYKAHCDAVLAAERKNSAALISHLQDNIAYLRSLVRNVSILAALFGAYSLYAYKTFDVHDPTRGLNRGGRTDLPFILFVIILSYIVVSMLVGLVRRLRKSSVKE